MAPFTLSRNELFVIPGAQAKIVIPEAIAVAKRLGRTLVVKFQYGLPEMPDELKLEVTVTPTSTVEQVMAELDKETKRWEAACKRHGR